MKSQWVRNIIADCRDRGVAPFHKQWGNYQNNPLVVEQGMSTRDAQALDKLAKGGRLVDGLIVQEYPVGGNSAHRNAA